MFDSITLGQYYQTDSVLHRLDPRVKLVGTFAYLISLFVVNSFAGYALAAVFLAVMIKLSNVPFRYIVRGMKTIVFLLLITVLFNLFLTPGEVIWQAWVFKITREGVSFAIRMALRLSLLILGSSIMTLTTTADRERRGFREQEPRQKDQEPRSAPCPAVHLGVPQSERPRHGDGSEMLPRRRRTDKDETAGLYSEGPRRVRHSAGVFCGLYFDKDLSAIKGERGPGDNPGGPRRIL